MSDLWWVGMFFIVLGLCACVFVLGHIVGQQRGWKRGFGAAKDIYSKPREMMQVPYPEDRNAARELLEAVRNGIKRSQE